MSSMFADARTKSSKYSGPYCDESWMPRGGDDHGHGTHCAGVVGGTSLGVAQDTNLVAVKILDQYGGGSTSNILRGMEWIIKDATENDRLEKSVISMSLGATRAPKLRARGKPDASMLACRIAAEKGIFMVAAAGNSREPVDRTTPAAEPQVCAIGAIDENDAHARFTNYGTGVTSHGSFLLSPPSACYLNTRGSDKAHANKLPQDLMAPGVNILSAFRGNTTKKLNGTSMAAPFVAGLGAYFMDLDGPGKSYPGYKMCERLKSLASYRKGVEEMKVPSNFTDTYSKYTKVASNGWGL
ncbi:oryzin precursor [Apiospora arundinis]|uniref:Oryzin n=1 Tax=Apiospora arundinis TaxID=335852 RepID=A0ABR2IDX3_9PEZI